MKMSFISKLCFLSCILFSLGLSFQLGTSAAADISIGLLDGRTVKTGSSNINILGTTTAVTDNNNETYFALPAELSNSKIEDTLVYTFENPVDINSYKLHILNYDNGPVSVYF